ncbi:MAG TPA: hypothetical protein VFC06_01830, partial [Demequina sp.]|nr:hypothetical protein [Demequina sp.]
MLAKFRSAFVRNAKRDDGEVLLSAIVVMVVVGMFIMFMTTQAWGISVNAKHTQREALAQEAVDIALSQAIYTLNENYGVVSDNGSYDTANGAYSRTLPAASSPASADLDSFNATKWTSFNGSPAGATKYGIQAQARWWIDTFDVSYDKPNTVDQNRVRFGGVIGNLTVEARVVTPDETVVYGYRAITVPLYQFQARAVQSSSDGVGLAYVLSPLSMFQHGVFGTQSVQDLGEDGFVKAWSPIASSGDITLDDPVDSTNLNDDQQRRYDADLMLFGQGRCLEYDTTSGSVVGECSSVKTLNTGFEVVPDTNLVSQMQEFCSTQGSEDFIASQQAFPSLTANDTTYCFRDFVMDANVNLPTNGASGRNVARIFVERNVIVKDGHHFLDENGTDSFDAPATDPQVAIYTLSTAVTLEGNSSGSSHSNLYLYAPNATCSPGMRADDPVTTSVDESLGRSWDMYLGSIVC